MRVNTLGGGYMNDFSALEFRALEFRALEFRALAFWRCVGVREAVGRLAAIAIYDLPMQAPATFTLDAVKRKTDAAIKNHAGQWA
ncbi:hypothetical protein V5F40_19145 [Xanthobacter sp. DSM 14520]|uniref:hypothetical protein n=1 Tax=Xanthobacter autotrophicus (strain ATCC BAA-1158 / Py2) TaxID=78245 RepID=UPI00372BF2CA